MQLGSKKLAALFLAFFAAWLVLKYLMPLLAPFLFGTALALAAEPSVSLLSRRLPRSVSSGIGVSLTFLLICSILLLLCAFVLRELGLLSGYLPDFFAALRQGCATVSGFLLWLTRHAPQSIQPILQENIHNLFSGGTALLEQSVRYGLGFAGNLLSHVPDSALNVGTALLSGFMISARLPRLKKISLRKIGQPRLDQFRTAWSRVRSAICGWLTAQFKLMTVTFVLLLLGLNLLRIPHAFWWSCAICLVDAFPVLGTGTVLIPWCVLQLLQGDTVRALGIGGLYLSISLIRSTLEPRLLGRHLGLDPLMTLFAMYAGFRIWGIGGMLLAPLLTVTALQALPENRTA